MVVLAVFVPPLCLGGVKGNKSRCRCFSAAGLAPRVCCFSPLGRGVPAVSRWSSPGLSGCPRENENEEEVLCPRMGQRTVP